MKTEQSTQEAKNRMNEKSFKGSAPMSPESDLDADNIMAEDAVSDDEVEVQVPGQEVTDPRKDSLVPRKAKKKSPPDDVEEVVDEMNLN